MKPSLPSRSFLAKQNVQQIFTTEDEAASFGAVAQLRQAFVMFGQGIRMLMWGKCSTKSLKKK